MIARSSKTMRAALARGCALGVLYVLAGCGFPPPQSAPERAAADDCRDDANRIYSAQNRYQLSERESPDTPFSGSTPPPLPSDGLSDRYGYDQMVSNCLRRSEAVPVTGTPN